MYLTYEIQEENSKGEAFVFYYTSLITNVSGVSRLDNTEVLMFDLSDYKHLTVMVTGKTALKTYREFMETNSGSGILNLNKVFKYCDIKIMDAYGDPVSVYEMNKSLGKLVKPYLNRDKMDTCKVSD